MGKRHVTTLMAAALAGLWGIGLAFYHWQGGLPFLELSDGGQVAALTSMEATPFLQAVRGNTVVALYNNKNVWPNFGYQGSSAEEGGYLYRGFQDAGWTMEPDADEDYMGDLSRFLPPSPSSSPPSSSSEPS